MVTPEMTEIDQAPVLPRELTELSAQVRAVGEPPTPRMSEPYGLRPVDPQGDAALLSEWMNRPHLAQAWECDWPTERWQRHLQAQIEGTYSRPFIVTLDGVDFGYIELYWAAKDSIATRYDADPYDVGLHAAIADTEHLNRGTAPAVLAQLMVSLFSAESLCRRIMIDPDHRNVQARRAAERSGFVFLGEHEMANRRMALYAFLRPDV
jgi:RimJ/RimL family protein N-acetyltransferase